jgi:hypothetical protein
MFDYKPERCPFGHVLLARHGASWVEIPQYVATIAVQDFTLTTLVFANLVPPPDAAYRALLGCAVLWYGQFQYDSMSSPKSFTLELPGENSARNKAPAEAASSLGGFVYPVLNGGPPASAYPAASGHEKIRVCGQLAPGSRPSFLQSCGH